MKPVPLLCTIIFLGVSGAVIMFSCDRKLQEPSANLQDYSFNSPADEDELEYYGFYDVFNVERDPINLALRAHAKSFDELISEEVFVKSVNDEFDRGGVEFCTGQKNYESLRKKFAILRINRNRNNVSWSTNDTSGWHEAIVKNAYLQQDLDTKTSLWSYVFFHNTLISSGTLSRDSISIYKFDITKSDYRVNKDSCEQDPSFSLDEKLGQPIAVLKFSKDKSVSLVSKKIQNIPAAAFQFSGTGEIPGLRRPQKFILKKPPVLSLDEIYTASTLKRFFSQEKSLGQLKELNQKPDKIRMAILDTGVDYNHPKIAYKIDRLGRWKIAGLDNSDKDNLPYPAFIDLMTFLDPGGQATAHGTHVAGIATDGLDVKKYPYFWQTVC